MPLRSTLLRIASELPKGDPTRREILAALSGKTAVQGGAEYTLEDKGNTLILVGKNFKKAAGKGDNQMTRMVKVNTKSALMALANALTAVDDETGAAAIEMANSRVRIS